MGLDSRMTKGSATGAMKEASMTEHATVIRRPTSGTVIMHTHGSQEVKVLPAEHSSNCIKRSVLVGISLQTDDT